MSLWLTQSSQATDAGDVGKSCRPSPYHSSVHVSQGHREEPAACVEKLQDAFLLPQCS